MDKLSPERRSWNMSQIKGKDTKPEILVRSLVHRMGYRFRLHRKDLPGRPDLVFPGRRKVIFVHGCFWHQHPGCKYATRPSTRADFWAQKLDGNRDRDKAVQHQLLQQGWGVLVVWECEIKQTELLADRLSRFLGK